MIQAASQVTYYRLYIVQYNNPHYIHYTHTCINLEQYNISQSSSYTILFTNYNDLQKFSSSNFKGTMLWSNHECFAAGSHDLTRGGRGHHYQVKIPFYHSVPSVKKIDQGKEIARLLGYNFPSHQISCLGTKLLPHTSIATPVHHQRSKHYYSAKCNQKVDG